MSAVDSRAEVGGLFAESAWALDQQDFPRYVSFFAEDVTYSAGGEVLRGRDALLRRFTVRQGQRTTRHLFSGLRLSSVGGGIWWAESVWLTFAAAGRPPIDQILPYQVADFHDEIVEHPDGWLIRSRTINSVFRDPHLAPAG